MSSYEIVVWPEIESSHSSPPCPNANKKLHRLILNIRQERQKKQAPSRNHQSKCSTVKVRIGVYGF